MDPTIDNSAVSPIKKLEEFLEMYLVKKAPFTLPAGFKEFLVKVGPWVNLVLLALSLPLILLALGVGAIILPFAFFTGGANMLQLVLLLISVVLQVIALPGLFNRTKRGWEFLFYALLASSLGRLLGGEIFNFIVFSLVSLYFLFQVKEYYR